MSRVPGSEFPPSFPSGPGYKTSATNLSHAALERFALLPSVDEVLSALHQVVFNQVLAVGRSAGIFQEVRQHAVVGHTVAVVVPFLVTQAALGEGCVVADCGTRPR